MKLTAKTRWMVAVVLGALIAASSTQGQTTGNDPYQALVKREFGTETEALAAIEKQIADTPPTQYAPIETRLIAVIETPEATMPGKQFACQMLRTVGSAQCIPAVSKLLTDEMLSHVARQVFLGLNDPAVDEALRRAVSQTQGKLRMGLVNTLGDRRQPTSLNVLATLIAGTDETTGKAALNAIGKIGGAQAADTLDRTKPSEALKDTWAQAYLNCAETLAATGDTTRAERMSRRLFDGDYPLPVRAGAFGLIAQQQKEKAAPLVVKTLFSDQALLKRAAGTAVINLPGKASTKALAQELVNLPVERKVILLSALAARGDAEGVTEIVNPMVSSDNPALRETAITALARLGNASSVPVLAAALKDQALAAKTSQTLVELQGPGVVEAMIKQAEAGDIVVRQGVLGVLADRRQVEALPVIRVAAKDTDGALRRAGLKAMTVLGTPEDLAWLSTAILIQKDEPEREQMAQTMAAIGTRMPDKTTRAEPVLGAFAKADDATKVCLLSVLSTLGGDQALQAVRSSLNATGDLRKTALRALADWPDPAPLPDLLRVAKEDPESANQILALRGYIRMAGLAGNSTEKKLEAYRTAMDLAQRPDEKRLVLAGLADVAHVDALKMVEPFLENNDLKREAFLAYGKIAESLARRQPTAAKEALQRVVDQASDSGVKNRAARALERMR